MTPEEQKQYDDTENDYDAHQEQKRLDRHFKTKRFWLLIKSGCDYPDFEDTCEAVSLTEAILKFKNNNKRALWQFSAGELKPHICEEPQAAKTETF